MGVPMADCGAVNGADCGLCPGRVKSGLARRVEGGLLETGELGRFLIEAEAFQVFFFTLQRYEKKLKLPNRK